MSILTISGWPAWLHVAACVVGIVEFSRFVMAMREFERIGNPDWRRFHHAYLGLALLLFPALPGAWIVLSLAVWYLAVDWIRDDADQHWEQLIHPGYESPWHRRYARILRWLARFTWGRWIVSQLKRVSLA